MRTATRTVALGVLCAVPAAAAAGWFASAILAPPAEARDFGDYVARALGLGPLRAIALDATHLADQGSRHLRNRG